MIMNICLSGRILEKSDPRPSLEEFLELALECGYEGVGLRPWQIPSNPTDAEIEGVRRLLASSGLRVCSLRFTDARYFERIIVLARALDIKVLQCGNLTQDMLDAWSRVPDPDIRFGPQTHSGGPFESVSGSAAELARIPDRRCGVIVEPGNLMFCGTAWTSETFMPLKGRIIGCYLQSVMVGEGDLKITMSDGRTVNCRRVPLCDNSQINLDEFINSLFAAGYDDFINVIEPADPVVPIRRVAAETASCLRAALAERGKREQGASSI